MTFLNPYVNFSGNAEEAFNFYKSIFGGEFDAVMRYNEMPAEYQMEGTNENMIMHISLPVGKSNILMGCDVPESQGKPVMGNSFHIAISTESEDEANKIFNGLVEGGQVVMPMEKAFWGSYFGMLKDKFGVQWMVSYDYGQRQ